MTQQQLAYVGKQFMEIMDDYQARQEDDPNFDPSTRLYDIYDEMVFIYDMISTKYIKAK